MTDSAEQAIIELVLPDGLEVACFNEYETNMLWQEIQGDSPYARAARGLGPDEVVLDVGAHIGLATLCFARLLPRTRILSFEPATTMGECLERNIARHAKNATAFRTALGAQVGEREFVYYPHASSKSTLCADEADNELNLLAFMDGAGFNDELRALTRRLDEVREHTTVPVTTLSTVFREHAVDRVGLLKVDVERAELEVLAGLDEELWPRVRRLLVEVHDRDGALGQAVAMLAGRGYTVEVTKDPAFAGGTVHMLFARRD
ncbi:FkbM family methyltransferase [Streptomyces sp. NPDC026206]|uniref:FkbM family methyltransferase n=1 Tax=Streptomyces sp. NPDC026206 TaxID=3157089 RepID=UPI0033D81E32